MSKRDERGRLTPVQPLPPQPGDEVERVADRRALQEFTTLEQAAGSGTLPDTSALSRVHEQIDVLQASSAAGWRARALYWQSELQRLAPYFSRWGIPFAPTK